MKNNVENDHIYPKSSHVDQIGFMGGLYELLDGAHRQSLVVEAMNIPTPREGSDTPL